MKSTKICFFIVFGLFFSFSQAQQTIKYTLNWQGVQTIKITETEKKEFLSFLDADIDQNGIPHFFESIDLAGYNDCSVLITAPIFVPLTNEEVNFIKKQKFVQSEINPEKSIAYAQKKARALVSFIPIKVSSNGTYEKLVSFELKIQPQASSLKLNGSMKPMFVPSSVLNTGRWYKIGITEDGIYKIDRTLLKKIGINPDSIDPANLRIYGNHGGMLPMKNSDKRPDDLTENAIFVSGQNDGKFDATDYILFAGQGPVIHKYGINNCSGATPRYYHQSNWYSDTTYYFITADLGTGKRIATQSNLGLTANTNVTAFDGLWYHEVDAYNLIKSGREWYGEYFDVTSNYDFSVSVPNIDLSSPVTLTVDLIARNNATPSQFSVTCNGNNFTITPPSIDQSCAHCDYAMPKCGYTTFVPSSNTFDISIEKLTPSALGWLNYVELNYRKQLIMSGSQMTFSDIKTVGAGNVSNFSMYSISPISIWEITDRNNVSSITLNTSTSNYYQFTVPTDSLRTFIAFTGQQFLTPTPHGAVANQNLHGLTQADYIIISHPLFLTEAERLAEHHITNDSLRTVIVTPQQIYNEFSSGAQDVSAIRDFIRMFYERAGSNTNDLPKYVLLLGDGSYDNKGKYASNTNFIVCYQSMNFNNPTDYTTSYVSDDFFALLDPNEGLFSGDLPDAGVGRIPVKNETEAKTTVDKILSYAKTGFPNPALNPDNANTPFGDWRNIVCFIADDEDNNTHISQANQIAQLVDTTYKNYNIDKIYLDAYKQYTTPAGQRYPDATEAFNRRVEKGALIINYSGHGGEVGLAHEELLNVPDINDWENPNKLSLFVTATCEFSRWDDPGRTSAGEYVLLNQHGGGIALLTTTRLVYAFPNFLLNRNFYREVFDPLPNGEMPRLGDVFKQTKQLSGTSLNNRNFSLLGDPALRLAYPMYSVETTSINQVAANTFPSDTMKALGMVTIQGFVKDLNGNKMTNFNGVIYPSVFDKTQTISTLSNDGNSSPAYSFKLQKNIIYRGKVSVTNGDFSFSFIVPKDISYNYGIGRISYYADNGTIDAAGYNENFVIGGASLKVENDVDGPELQLFMNDEKFIKGGITDENPDILLLIKDNNGINTLGNGIGHDITGTLDDDNENTFVMNDYYEADLNSYQSGKVRFPLEDLNEGKHTLKVKVWDVYNNSSSAYTEFVVAKLAELALSHVLNYPNPFTTNTSFFFEHNQPGSSLNVSLQIFTISGKMVKTFNMNVNTDGYRADPIIWDGTDDYGDKIGKGVYLYKLKVKSEDGKYAEKLEKLVILN